MTNKRVVSKVCILLGCFLLVASVVATVWWQWEITSSEKTAKIYTQTIRSLIPTSQGAVLEEKQNNKMPVLSVQETDFVGILEIPSYNSELPVCASWGEITKYPCQYSGSIYNGTMQIGISSQKGQYDFYREISVGDAVLFTDMQGNCYTYTVSKLRYEKHANNDALTKENADLTLFIKNVYDFEYLIVYCNT